MGGSVSRDWRERLEKGRQRMPCDEGGKTDLHLAAEDGPPPAWLKHCIQKQLPETVNARTVDGYSVMHHAVMNRNVAFVEMLLLHPQLRTNELFVGPFDTGKVSDRVRKLSKPLYAKMQKHPNFNKREEVASCTPAAMADMHLFLGGMVDGIKDGGNMKNAGKRKGAQVAKPKKGRVTRSIMKVAKKGTTKAKRTKPGGIEKKKLAPAKQAAMKVPKQAVMKAPMKAPTAKATKAGSLKAGMPGAAKSAKRVSPKTAKRMR